MSSKDNKADESSPSMDEKNNDLSNPVIREKYSKAAEIANGALSLAISLCKADARIVDITSATDKYITEEAGKHYKDKKVEKGIAFPTCVSVNNIVGHFSPLNSDSAALKANDLIKIDLGVHIDGFIAVAAHTITLQPSVTGKAAALVHAAHTALDACQRLIKVGGTNSSVTDMIGKVCAEFKVNAVQGVLSHQLKKFIIDGDKVIINRFDPEHKVEEVTFAPNEVYAVDIVFTTGDGKPKAIDERATIFKKNAQTTYQLKQSISREVFAIVNQKYPTFPFAIRDFESEAKAKMAMRECAQHELVAAYPVLHEKDGELVAQVKSTFLVTDKGTVKLTGLELDRKSFFSEHKIVDEEVRRVLNSSTSIGGAKKKKKPAAKKEGEAAEAK